MRMAPRKKAAKEEILQKKREAERKRYHEMKNDPQKREELRARERLKYLMKKERGTRKLVNNMTRREHQDAKKKWKEHCTKYRHRKKSNLQDVTSQSEKLRRNESPTDSVDVSDLCLSSTDDMLGTEEENEFDLFCRSLAVQLKRMPLEKALRCQEKLQAVMSAERLEQLGSPTHKTESHTETALIDYIKIEPEEIL